MKPTSKQAKSRGRGGPAATERSLGLGHGASAAIPDALRVLLADVFSLYFKTKNFHWHITGPHFRDYHRLLDEHADQLLEMTDPIAERARKIGGSTLRSIGELASLRRIQDDDRPDLDAITMLTVLLDDNRALARSLRDVHEVCDNRSDVATASLIENWIDQTEGRAWFLSEMTGADRARQ